MEATFTISLYLKLFVYTYLHTSNRPNNSLTTIWHSAVLYDFLPMTIICLSIYSTFQLYYIHISIVHYKNTTFRTAPFPLSSVMRRLFTFRVYKCIIYFVCIKYDCCSFYVSSLGKVCPSSFILTVLSHIWI